MGIGLEMELGIQSTYVAYQGKESNISTWCAKGLTDYPPVLTNKSYSLHACGHLYGFFTHDEFRPNDL